MFCKTKRLFKHTQKIPTTTVQESRLVLNTFALLALRKLTEVKWKIVLKTCGRINVRFSHKTDDVNDDDDYYFYDVCYCVCALNA